MHFLCILFIYEKARHTLYSLWKPFSRPFFSWCFSFPHVSSCPNKGRAGEWARSVCLSFSLTLFLSHLISHFWIEAVRVGPRAPLMPEEEGSFGRIGPWHEEALALHFESTFSLRRFTLEWRIKIFTVFILTSCSNLVLFMAS